MKRFVSVILCICLIVAGCSKGKEEDHINEFSVKATDENIESDILDDDVKDSKDETDLSKFTTLSLNKEWAAVTLAGISQPDFVIPTSTPKVNPYVINKDLSNIENLGQFSGFTMEQIKMLSENGFIVLPGNDTRMHYVYDSNEYLGVPNFITSDSVLHLYHQFYDKSLMLIETNYLYDYLDQLTRQMLDKSIRLMDLLEDDDLKAIQEKNIIYFLLARMLMLNTPDLEVKVSDDIYELAKEEYELIEQAKGFIESPTLGFDFDYSQFTIRGHYTRSEELGRFFRTMMWFGTLPLPLINKEGNVMFENVLQSLLMSYTTFLDTQFICDAELWSNIYQPTEQYVGVSDDINVFMMNGLRLEVFGEIDDPNIFNDEEYYDNIILAVQKLPEPRIKGKLIDVTTPTEKQFRYMGQRYILDSFIMQELIFPILRPIPSALDTMGVLGSELAEDLLFNYYKPQKDWPEYEEKYYKLKEEVSAYGVDIWGENLYNGWLWSIKENLIEYDRDSGMPYFMTNDAWKAKSLNASIGSYTELKHDTVLYGKQAVAEMGGGIDYEQADYHYVEPNVNLYSKLLYLTEYTMSVLRERDMLSAGLEEGATIYQELLMLLIECSIKELDNERLTEKEYDDLLYYGAKMEGISNTFLYAMLGDSYEAIDIADMLVTDISTTPGYYLSLGTGYFDHIYVVVPREDKLYLSRGSVYSSYEFISDTRLTDEQWWELNGIKIIREEYGDYPTFTEPSEHLPAQPVWVKEFKTSENNVIIERMEVDWALLVE
jgi:hypothetical protein